MNSQMPCNNSVISRLAPTTLKYMGESIQPSLLLLPAWFIIIQKRLIHAIIELFFCSPSALRLLISPEMWSFCPSFNRFNYLRRHELQYLHFIYQLLIIQGLINSWAAPVMSFSFLSHFFNHSISHQHLSARMDSGLQILNPEKKIGLEEVEILSPNMTFFNSSGILILSELCEGRSCPSSPPTSSAQQGAWHNGSLIKTVE